MVGLVDVEVAARNDGHPCVRGRPKLRCQGLPRGHVIVVGDDDQCAAVQARDEMTWRVPSQGGEVPVMLLRHCGAMRSATLVAQS